MKRSSNLLRGPLKNIFLHNIKSLIVFFVPCLVLLLLFFNVRNDLDRRMVLEKEFSTAEKITGQLNTRFENLTSSVQIATFSSSITRLCQTEAFALSNSLMQTIGSIQDQILSIRMQNPMISSLTVHSRPINFFVQEQSAYAQKASAAHPREEAGILHLESGDFKAGWFFLEGQMYYFAPVTVKHARVGSILARLTRTNVDALLSDLVPNHEYTLLLTDSEGVIWGDSSSGAGKSIEKSILRAATPSTTQIIRLSGVPTTLTSFACTVPGLWVQVLAPQRQLLSQYRSTLLFISILTFFVLVVLVVLVYLSAVILSRPYETIIGLLNEPSLLTDEEYNRKYRHMDDLGMISTLIHQRNYQYLAAKEQVNEKEHMLRDVQNAMLLAQMNPHFLFNTLDSINWMVMDLLPEGNKVSAAIFDLSKLLRISLKSTSPLTLVQQEVEHAQLYLDIQNRRMEDPVNVEWNVDESLLNSPILCLSLQPLLENAISHGIRSKRNGCIRIGITEKEGKLVVTVWDNGQGIPPEELAQLRRRLNTPLIPRDRHIGLANIGCRLNLIYGDDASLTIESEQGQYTLVTMTLPAHQPPDTPGLNELSVQDAKRA